MQICRRQAREILNTENVTLVTKKQITYDSKCGIHMKWPKNSGQGWTVESTTNATVTKQLF